MIIFLYGKDSYRRKQKEKEIIESYKQKRTSLATQTLLDLKKFDLETNDFEELKDFLRQFSLFEGLKLCLVKNLFTAISSKTKSFNKAKSFLKDISKKQDVFLIISEDSKSKSKEFDFLSKKPCLCQEFEELKGEKLASFLKKEIEKRKLDFSRDALNYLIEISSVWEENKTWFLIKELEKISLAGLGVGSAQISLSQLKNISSSENILIKENIFNLIKTFRFSVFRQKIVALEKLFVLIEPAYLFNLLGMNKELILKLSDYDCLIKSGKLEHEIALLNLTLESG